MSTVATDVKKMNELDNGKLQTIISGSPLCVTLRNAIPQKAFKSSKNNNWYQSIDFMGGQIMIETSDSGQLESRDYELIVLSASVRQGEITAKHVIFAK